MSDAPATAWRTALHEDYLQNSPVTELVERLSDHVDDTLERLFKEHIVEGSDSQERAENQVELIAVGGYGRKELFPHSDVDILILSSKPVDDKSPLGAAIAAFMAKLWDIGFKIGAAVRSIDECVEIANSDVTVITNLLESRTLAGNASPTLFEQLQVKLDSAGAWNSAAFFHAKRRELEERHQRFGHIDYNLEPNIKESPGGLRDIQTIAWVAQKHFGTQALQELRAAGFLTDFESRIVSEASEFLWRIRWSLHMLAGRAEERLLFDHQRELAAQFGYTDDGNKRAVEQFMHEYYLHVLRLRNVSDVLFQFFEETTFSSPEQEQVQVLSTRFRLRNGYLETTHPQVFIRHPSALLELFVVLGENPEISGVRSNTIRQIREHLHLIDRRFRNNKINTALFMRLLRAPHKLVTQLTRMRRYGVLGRYLPEFGDIVGQMQHDLFHIYTVDAHTLEVIRNMRRFRYESSAEKFPVACHCIRQLRRVELLYIAGLYHDIGKGRGGDHSELGEVDVRDFCARHDISQSDTDLIAWMVRHHLEMSSTAQRKDITDPEVIFEFAEFVQTQERLDYLYALTVADINATNPTLWNGWRASLMHQLYNETKKLLKRGLEDAPDRAEAAATTRELALAKLAEAGIDETSAASLWPQDDERFFLEHNHNEIVWQTQALMENTDPRAPVVRVRDTALQANDYEGGTLIFVHTLDRASVFSTTVSSLDKLGLSVQDARIHTTDDGRCYNSFIVLEQDGQSIGDNERRISEVEQTLTRALMDGPDSLTGSSRITPLPLKQFQFPTDVNVINSESDLYSTIRIVAADRPGLLASIGAFCLQEKIEVHSARITTLGERVEDQFFISRNGRKLISREEMDRLSVGLRNVLDDEIRRAS